jgi:2-iminobutanoate/2-iminopropanoate deaminase
MKITNIDKAPAAIGPYSQAIASNGLLFVSGQLPINPQTGVFPGNTISLQAEQSCRNIEAILKANGIGFESVIKTTCFLQDMSDFGGFNQVYDKFFVSKPARSCVAVKELPKGALCEIELVAIL